jgi:DNA-binding transcriptional ArsR family regulator
MNADNDVPASIPADQVNLIVEVFRMLADPTRIRVLWALTRGELAVNELAEQLGKPAPSVSQHLAKLRMARLVRTRREGTTIFYSLKTSTSANWLSMRSTTRNMPAPRCPATTAATTRCVASPAIVGRARRLSDDTRSRRSSPSP